MYLWQGLSIQAPPRHPVESSSDVRGMVSAAPPPTAYTVNMSGNSALATPVDGTVDHSSAFSPMLANGSHLPRSANGPGAHVGSPVPAGHFLVSPVSPLGHVSDPNAAFLEDPHQLVHQSHAPTLGSAYAYPPHA